MARADTLLTDSLAQTAERGEFQHALSQGVIKITDVTEIGRVAGAANGGNERADLARQGEVDGRLTIFDTSGVACEDIMITKLVYGVRSRSCVALAVNPCAIHAVHPCADHPCAVHPCAAYRCVTLHQALRRSGAGETARRPVSLLEVSLLVGAMLLLNRAKL